MKNLYYCVRAPSRECAANSTQIRHLASPCRLYTFTMIARFMAVCVRTAVPKLQVSALLTDYAVLQSSASGGGGPGVVRGSTAPGATVSLRSTGGQPFPGAPYATTATSAGTWAIALDSDAALLERNAPLGPFSLVVSDGQNNVTASNVFYGDVFFCGGQSNMVFTVDAIARAKEELAAADHPNIRLFQLARDQKPNIVPFDRAAGDVRGTVFGLLDAAAPAPDLRDVAGSCLYGSAPSNPCDSPVRTWVGANATFVGRFSAICYLASRDILLNRTSSGAIGLIESDYGGTPLQAWSPPSALSACGMSLVDCRTYSGGNCKNYPSRLFSRMVAPFAGWGLRSFVFYQGEANSDEGFPLYRSEYRCLFGAMIRGWREAWAKAQAEATLGAAPVVKTPFVFVQLSSWTGNWGFESLPCVASYCPVIARIKLAQADVAGLGGAGNATENVAMAVADDWGATQSAGVHPPFKTQPAQRVARQLLALAFGEGSGVAATGPVVASAALVAHAPSSGGATVTLSFSFSANADGLTLQGTNDCDQQYSKKCCNSDGAAGPVMGRFCTHANATLCAADAGDGGDNGVYLAQFALSDSKLTATATVTNGQPVRYVDYQMTDFPQCKVVNKDGLPLSTFGPLAVDAGSALPRR